MNSSTRLGMTRRSNVLGTFALADCHQATLPSEITELEAGIWALESLSSTEVPNPEAYRLAFEPSGMSMIWSDCNHCTGTWEARGNNLTINVEVCTRNYCGKGSLDLEYRDALSSATRFERRGKLLYLHYNGGTMIFESRPPSTS